MEEALSLSWDAHQDNICSGLSVLQQRGEFVDMTLAADGHHVKVHQMIMSLVSPYIKELISSAQCPHPVIFLNNISYTTLCAILEYIYTGQVQLPKENLSELLAAGRALHIKGLREMEDESPCQTDLNTESSVQQTTLLDKLRECKENKKKAKEKPQPMCEIFVNSDNENEDYCKEESNLSVDEKFSDSPVTVPSHKKIVVERNKEYGNSLVQYSISNQGNLQVIVNRYIYNLKYIQKNLNRYWRCVDYGYRKCPASIYTDNKNAVLQRKSNHNHTYHDGKIIKKVHKGVVFAAFKEAEDRAKDKKTEDIIQIIDDKMETTKGSI